MTLNIVTFQQEQVSYAQVIGVSPQITQKTIVTIAPIELNEHIVRCSVVCKTQNDCEALKIILKALVAANYVVIENVGSGKESFNVSIVGMSIEELVNYICCSPSARQSFLLKRMQ